MANLAEQVFAQKFNEPLVHQVINAYLVGAHTGTKAQKNRSAVRGGGAKPWRQKGTGRARAGTIRSPLWRGGGRTFAASPHVRKQKVNRKMYHQALCSILSELVRQDRFVVVDKFELSEAKTKLLVEKLKALKIDRALIITDKMDNKLQLAARNLPNINFMEVKSINPVSLIASEKVLITSAAVKQLEDRLS